MSLRELGVKLGRRWRKWRCYYLLPRRVWERPLGVVVAVRNRSGQRVENFLQTLRRQTVPPEQVEIVVCDFGSEPDHARDIRARCARHGARYIYTPDGPVWNKSRALNIAIQHTSPTAEFILSTDIDLLFAPNFVETVLRVLTGYGPCLVLCQFRDLPAGALRPETDLRAEFGRLCRMATWHDRSGTGGCQAAPRAWFFRVRGYDERLRLWGGMDEDLLRRARRDGLEPVWIQDRTALLHQWHRRKWDFAQDSPAQEALIRRYWEENHRLIAADPSIVRNREGWGMGDS